MSGGLFDDRTTRGDFPCPWCDEPNDAAVHLGDKIHRPGPGDIGLCFSCAQPSIYQEHGKPRRPTEAEWKILNDDPGITAKRRAIFMTNMTNKGNVNYGNLGIAIQEDD